MKHIGLGFLFASAFFVFGAENMIGRQSQNEGIMAVPAKAAVMIDGDLGDWDLSGEMWSFSDYSVRDQFSVRTAAMWDKEFLYLSFRWKDSTPLNSAVDPEHDPTRGWVADAVQLRFQAGAQIGWITAWCFGAERANLHLDYWGSDKANAPHTITLYKGKGNPAKLGDGIESAYRKSGDGFVHELKIPWAILFREPGKTVRAGDSVKMGMEFIWGAPNGRSVPVLHRYADNMATGVTSREFYWEKVSAWGELRCVDAPVAEKRRYVPDDDRPRGANKLRIPIPAEAKFFTLAIDDATGKRVRNLAGGFPVADFRVSDSEVEVEWDGLDDTGNALHAAEYRLRGLTHKGLSARYELSFYNPGNPVWPTADGRGAWGADHTRAENIASAGANMVIAAPLVEGGYGLWAVGPDGKKVWSWSDARGIVELAANKRYVFAVPLHPSRTPVQYLFRFHSKDGSVAQFDERPMETPLAAFTGVPASALALAATEEVLAAALADGSVVLLDPETGKKRGAFQADFDFRERPEPLRCNQHTFKEYDCPFAVSEDRIVFFRKGNLIVRERATGSETDWGKAAEKPSALAFDRAGNVLVADCGSAMRILQLDRSGKRIGAFGAPGGRPRQGVFFPEGMREMSSIAVDARNDVWAVEYTDFPRRVSVWNEKGLVRDYIGNTTYSANGSFLHDQDASRAFIGPVELALDYAKRTWRVSNILWNPVPGTTGALRIEPENNKPGHIFRRDSDGAEYYFVPPARDWDGFVVLRNFGGAWRPTSAVTTAGRLAGEIDHYGNVVREPGGEFTGLNAYDGVYWNDKNGDGVAQRAECVIVPTAKPGGKNKRGVSPFPFRAGWGQKMHRESLAFYASDDAGVLWRYRLPLAPETLERVAEALTTDIVPEGENLYGFESYDSNRKARLFGRDARTGRILWTYPSPFHHVHGSHNATMPKPGLLIGPLKIAGIAGETMMLRGNLGQDFFVTTDGLFVGSLFSDVRIPGPSFPASEAALLDFPMERFSMGSEPFNGWFGRHADGVTRMSCGLFGQAGTVMRIEGLESIRRLPERTWKLDSVTQKVANAENARTYTIGRFAGYGKLPEIRFDGARARLGWTKDTLHFQITVEDDSPWINGGSDFRKLFKTGDCADLQLGDGNAACRILIAPFSNVSTVVLMREKAPGAPESENMLYSSPVMNVRFDSVKILKEAKAIAVRRDGSYTVEAVIPWNILPFRPEAGMTLRGDVGYIRSDNAGMRNIARVYWANPATGLVSDLPNEARIDSARWGKFTLE